MHLIKDQDLPLEIGWRIGDQRNQILTDIINAV
jgi:hypothetical protein